MARRNTTEPSRSPGTHASGPERSLPLALVTVLLAGISESVGQSVVLFANRVKPARFLLSLLIGALLVAFGYGFVVISTWATFYLPGARHVRLDALATAIALSYAPLVFSFLAALPYAGTAVLWALRLWQLVSMVVGVAIAARLPLLAGAGHVALGWIVMIVAQRTFGKPIVNLGVRIANAAAGTTLVQETAAVRRFVRQLMKASTPVRQAGATESSKKRHGIPIFSAVIVTFVFVAAIVIALTPLRRAIVNADVSAVIVRIGLDIAWVVIVAIVVAAFLAPLETLGWWAGWYGDDVETAGKIPEPSEASSAPEPRRYIVYLDGVSQSSSVYTPDIEIFLDALAAELPSGARLIRGIMAYSAVNRPLDDDPLYARFWKFVVRLRGGATTAIIGMFVNIRNVMIVAVSADRRYGPLYNLGIAQVVFNGLVDDGYRKQSGIPVTLLGYSGGGQMCAEVAPLLKRAVGANVQVISLAGVMTGSCPFLKIDHFYHMYGSKDIVEPLGPLMFSSRWKLFANSNWNRARRRGKITIYHLGPVGHQVPGGLLDPNLTLPDGRSALRQTLDTIETILTRSVTQSIPAKKTPRGRPAKRPRRRR